MKDKENTEEYVEVSLGEYLMYSKVVRFCLVLILLLGSIGGFIWEYGQIQEVDQKVQELANYDGYDFETHARAVTSQEIANKASKFRESDWFKKRDLTDSTLKSSVFSKKDKSYYVIFYKDDCAYCNQLESKMSSNLNKLKKKNIYWSDITEAKNEDDEDSNRKKEIVWTDEDYDEYYSTTKKEFMVSGTPTMIRITKGEKNIRVYIGVDKIVEELGV